MFPSPLPITLQPQLFAAYGALVAAGMLGVLYLYRGRAFVVYWIGSWVLIAASLVVLARGYADPRVGAVMIGLAQLLGAWSAGLTLLAGEAFPAAPLRWGAPVKVAAATAAWFLASPFLVPVAVVMATGQAAAGILFGWAAVRYFRVVRRTRYVGAFLVGVGLASIAAANALAVGVVFHLVIYMFLALGVHVLVFEDMTDELRRTNRDLEEANAAVKRLAITDPLTGCSNRRFFDEIERREMQRHRRYGAPIAVVFVDVNRFKKLNDTMGHDVGDRILRSLGALLRRQVRESDYVIRWGGDEFVLLLTCGLDEATRKAADLKQAFTREVADAGFPRDVGLSVGIAMVSGDAEGLEEAIRVADTRMYRDKADTRAAE